MVLIDINNASIAFGEKEIIKNVTLQVKQGDIIGITGENGAGKSTLFKAIVGINELSSGRITVTNGVRIGYLEQQHNMQSELTVFQEASKSFEKLFEAEARMEKIQQQMAADSADIVALGEKYDKAYNEFEALGGYAWNSRLNGVLKGLGLTEEFWDKSVSCLSGGEKTRLALAKMLLENNDVLLLDEPTNHLDLNASQWLTDYLARFSGTVMLISHDRYMMDKLCKGIGRIENGKMQFYKGNYTEFCKKWDDECIARQKAFDAQQNEIQRQRAIIARYRQFNREKSIRAAESREKKLAKMEILEAPVSSGEDMRLNFNVKRESGNDVLKIEGITKEYNERILFSDFSYNIKKGQKIAVIGGNGAGKTTFCDIVSGRRAADKGTVMRGVNVDIGIYEQTQREFFGNESVMDMVWRGDRNLSQTQVRSRCAAMLFFGEDVFKIGDKLSGGERARCALCCLSLKNANTLFLDEPTNHLDMDSREVLEDALERYTGTVIAVSHDRYFINRIFNTLFIVENGNITVFEGNYDQYLLSVSGQDEVNEVSVNKTQKTKEAKKERQKRDEDKKQRAYVRQLEGKIEELEKLKKKLENEFSSSEVYSDIALMLKKQEEYKNVNDELDRVMKEWLENT